MTNFLQYGHFINHQDISGSDPLEVRDPGRRTQVLGSIAQATPSEVALAARGALVAFEGWRSEPLAARGERLLQVADELTRCAAALADILVREQGMVRAVTETEIALAADEIRNTVERGIPFLADEVRTGERHHTEIGKRPFGVIAGIVPWNAPIVLTMNMLAPALLAGNTIVLKPSELAPLGVNFLIRSIARCFPSGVINLVNGGRTTSQCLIEAPEVSKVSFTGGAATAKAVMAACAKHLKDVQLELGGNDPAVVLEDADLALAVPALAQASFRRSGQYCFAVKRIYVARPIYEEFLEAFCREVDKFRVGHPSNPLTTLGPVISETKTVQIRQLISESASRGARVFELGTMLEVDPSTGNYLLPTVVSEPDEDDRVVTEEQFGPVIPLMSFTGDDDAVRMANRTDFGLCASVWSRDFERARRVASRLVCGRVYLNAHRATPEGHRIMPFGGVKQSGIGWSNGVHGVAAFVQFHSIDGART